MTTALERSLLKLQEVDRYGRGSDVPEVYFDLTRQERFDEVDALEIAVRLLDEKGIGYKFPSNTDIKKVARPKSLDLTDGDVESAVVLCMHYGFEIGD